jgi:hypothetical protein
VKKLLSSADVRRRFGLFAALAAFASASWLVIAATAPDDEVDGATGAETTVSSITVGPAETAAEALPAKDSSVAAAMDDSAPRVVSASPAIHLTPEGRFTIQLGPQRNSALTDVIDRDAVKNLFARLNGDRDVRYRLKVSGFASRNTAAEVCALVRKLGSACMVSGPSVRQAAATAAAQEAKPTDNIPARTALQKTDGMPPFSVQLGAYRYRASLESALARLRRTAPDLLGRQKMEIQESTVDGQQMLRLRTTHLRDEKTARALCQSLIAADISCVVAKSE